MKKSGNFSEIATTAGTSALGGFGVAALIKLLHDFSSRKGSKRTIDIDKDYGAAGSGSIPVYVDMDPEQAARYESLTGKKVASHVPDETLHKLAGDLNWLAKGAIGLGGGYVGYKVFQKIVDTMKQRDMDRKLEDAKAELADLYTTSIDDELGAPLPGAKKLAYLANVIDGCFDLYENRAESFREIVKLEKTAGIVGDISSLGFEPIKGTAKSTLTSLAPFIAAILLASGATSYMAARGGAGDRDLKKVYRQQLREDKHTPYVELTPRLKVKQKAKELDPANIEG